MRSRLSLRAVEAGVAIALTLVAPSRSTLVAQIYDSAWTIKAGSFAGQTVPIDKSAASRRSSRFWRISDVGGQKRIVGWNPSRLPARVAFRPGRGISAADSSAFWEILERMQADMGMRLFEAASLDKDSDPDDFIVIDTKPMSSAEGLTMVTWSSGGTLYDARVYLRATETLRNPRVVVHEMMHALGFGHTSAWTSVMNGYGGGNRGLTREDVAYAQLALESRAASEREDLWDRLALAADREPASDLRERISACEAESPGSFLSDPALRNAVRRTLGTLAAASSCNSR
jgi:hypothetical protein